MTPSNRMSLKKIEPDYKHFGEHLASMDEMGIPYGRQDLIRLAKIYNTPIPGTKGWEKEFCQNENEKSSDD